MKKHLQPEDYLKKILTARVYDVAVESALEPARNLSRRLHNKVLLKREDQQPVFSFKLRGAYNKMAHLSPGQLERGVICASAGNHAQGVALAAHKMGARAVIVMPVTTPQSFQIISPRRSSLMRSVVPASNVRVASVSSPSRTVIGALSPAASPLPRDNCTAVTGSWFSGQSSRVRVPSA